MPTATKQKSIEELLEKAGQSLARGAAFEAERMALKALLIARQLSDFTRMTQIIPTLRDARRRRREQALKKRKVMIWEGPITENVIVKPGCYVVEPPLVGADARRLRIAALQSEVPVAVICREPLTKTGLWPIVAIGAGMTVRTRIEPPRNQSKPDLAWFTGAMEALGECAIQSIDLLIDLPKRIDVILARLDTVPDHDGLHDLLLEACREAPEESDPVSSEIEQEQSQTKAKS